MKTIKFLFLIQLLILIASSCSSEKGEQPIDETKLMAAYKDNYQSKPEILSIEMDTIIDKAQMLNYFDSIAVLEKEKQIVENKLSEEALSERLKTGEHWFEDRQMTKKEEKSIQKMLDSHKEKIASVRNGGERLDSVITLRKIAHFQKLARHDTIKYEISFFTVEQKASDQSGIKYDKWLSIKTNELGSMEEKFLSLPPKTNTASITDKVLNEFVSFNPYKKYRRY